MKIHFYPVNFFPLIQFQNQCMGVFSRTIGHFYLFSRPALHLITF